MKDKPNVCVVTWPLLNAGFIPLKGLLQVLDVLTGKLTLITGGAITSEIAIDLPKIQVHSLQKGPKSNPFIRIIRWIPLQLSISWHVIKVAGRSEQFIFFFGGPWMVLPMLTAKCCRRKVILIYNGSDVILIREQIGRLVSQIMRLLERITCNLADRIILHADNLAEDWNLERYENKILIASKHFVDSSQFHIDIPFSKRNNRIGFLGRLSKEKGIGNFLESASLLVENDNIEVIIAGDGEERSLVEQTAAKHHIEYVGWLPHDSLPDYLNTLRLLVIPSFVEGFPYVMLEAMACGTLVLASPVGNIPMMIKDGQNGFIMENNSPECISNNVNRVLNHPDLDQIILNARRLIQTEYSFEAAVSRYDRVLFSTT